MVLDLKTMESLDPKGFAEWLKRRGRADNTVRAYVRDLRSCTQHPRGMLGKLRDRLAPKTVRRTYAVLRSWAKFTGDQSLASELDDILLPAAKRVTARTPLGQEAWLKLMRALPLTHDVHPATRTIIEIMALRGIRVGDVLRMQRGQVERALTSGLLVIELKKRVRHEFSVRPIEPQLRHLLSWPDWFQVMELVLPEDTEAVDPVAAAGMAIWRALQKVGDVAGIENLHPHRLRRTYATEFLAEVGGDLEKLRQHMGWADLATAAGYADHDRRVELDAVAAAMMEKKRGS